MLKKFILISSVFLFTIIFSISLQASVAPYDLEFKKWKTYTNKQFGLQFRYPERVIVADVRDTGKSELKVVIKEVTSVSDPYIFKIDILLIDTKSQKEEAVPMNLLIRPKPANFINLNNFVKKKVIECKKTIKQSTTEVIKATCYSKKVKIGNIKGVAVIAEKDIGIDPGPLKNTNIFFEKGKYLFEISDNSPGWGWDYNTINKILSTFKFINL